MNIKDFESIKSKIEILKQKKAKAEGAIETISAEWKKTYGFESVQDAEKKYNELEDELETVEKKIATIYEELTGLTNWGII
jgi:predicted  nucleic acid-binding Zn-ribbon protein